MLRRSLFTGVTATILFLLGASLAAAQTTYDTGPEQTGRIHTTMGEAANLLEGADLLVVPGKLTVAVSPYLPPTSFYATDSATVIGLNPDVISLVAEKLGLELDMRVVAFPDWPLSITSHRYDVFIGSTTITEERKKNFDFSSYSRDLAAFFVANQSATTEITEPRHIAGLNLIVSSGTVAEKIVLDWDAQNQKAGLAPVQLQYFDDPAAAELSLRSGRSDAQFVGNYAEGVYNATTSGQTRLVGYVGGWSDVEALAGIVTARDSGLAEPITAALNELIAEGTFAAAFNRWGMADAAVSISATNPPGLPIN